MQILMISIFNDIYMYLDLKSLKNIYYFLLFN